MVNGEEQNQNSATPISHRTKPNKQQLLDQIRADIIEQNICSHLAKQANGLVFGEGDPDADIVFIGEAPGKREDELLQPFVGASGKFLAEMLASINLKREQVYITNIVKYRPPQNRDPLPEEKRDFLPFLVRQLSAIQPLLVVTLGRHSGEAFIPGLKISVDHGHPKRIALKDQGPVERKQADAIQGAAEKRTEVDSKSSEGVSEAATQKRAAKLDMDASSACSHGELKLVILPLYHPAAALYNGGQRQLLIDDFSLIPAILTKLRKEL